VFACICRAVTEDEVCAAIDRGATTTEAVQTITEMFQADMAVEAEAIDRLRRGIDYMRGVSDVTSANIFESILADEEQHIDYLETQLGLIDQIGEPLYLAQLLEQPSH
jgi:bacterioferritin